VGKKRKRRERVGPLGQNRLGKVKRPGAGFEYRNYVSIFKSFVICNLFEFKSYFKFE
jgi:hypothetical protein